MAPNSKLQTPKKLQLPSSKAARLREVLEFAVWEFSGAWCLGFGVSILSPFEAERMSDCHVAFGCLGSGSKGCQFGWFLELPPRPTEEGCVFSVGFTSVAQTWQARLFSFQVFIRMRSCRRLPVTAITLRPNFPAKASSLSVPSNAISSVVQGLVSEAGFSIPECCL